MAESKTVTIYRPQGSDPIGSAVGGYVIGKVHRDVPRETADYLVKQKGFRVVDRDFDPAKEKATAEATPEPATEPPADITKDAGATKRREG